MKNLMEVLEEQGTEGRIVKRVIGLYINEGPEAVTEVFLDAMALHAAQILDAELSAAETARELAKLFLQVSDRLSALSEDAKRQLEVV
jgi:hypothetical protein